MDRVGRCSRRRADAFVAYFRRISQGGWVFSGLRASEVGRCHGLGGRRDLLWDGPSSIIVSRDIVRDEK